MRHNRQANDAGPSHRTNVIRYRFQSSDLPPAPPEDRHLLIPCVCPHCGSALTRAEMQRFLDSCERAEINPLEEAGYTEHGLPRRRKPGVPCNDCLLAAVDRLYGW